MKLFTRSLKALATAGAVALTAFTLSSCGDDDDDSYNNVAYIPEYIEGFQIQGAIVMQGESTEFYTTPIVGLTFIDDTQVRIRFYDGQEFNSPYTYTITVQDQVTGEVLESAIEIDVPNSMISDPNESGSFYYIVLNSAQDNYQVALGDYSAYIRSFTSGSSDEIPFYAANGTLTLIEL